MTTPEFGADIPESGEWVIDRKNSIRSQTVLLKEDLDPTTGVLRQWRKGLITSDNETSQLVGITDIFPGGLPKRDRNRSEGFSGRNYYLYDEQSDGTKRDILYMTGAGMYYEHFTLGLDLPRRDFPGVNIGYENGAVKSARVLYSPKPTEPTVLYYYRDPVRKFLELANIYAFKGAQPLGGEITSSGTLEVDEIRGTIHEVYLSKAIGNKREKGWTEEDVEEAVSLVSNLLFYPAMMINHPSEESPSLSEEELEKFLGRIGLEITAALPDDFPQLEDDRKTAVIRESAENIINEALRSYYMDLSIAGHFDTRFEFPEDSSEPLKVTIKESGGDYATLLSEELQMGQGCSYDRYNYSLRAEGDGQNKLVVEDRQNINESFTVSFPSNIDMTAFKHAVEIEDRTGWVRALDPIKTHYEGTIIVAPAQEEAQQTNESLPIRSGVPFNIPAPDFTNGREHLDSITLDPILFASQDGVRGAIKTYLDKTFLTKPPYHPVRLPAGPLRIQYMGEDKIEEVVIEDHEDVDVKIEGDQPNYIRETLPIALRIDLDLPANLFAIYPTIKEEVVELYMQYGEETFKAKLEYEEEGSTSGRVSLVANEWVDLQNNENCMIFFPQNPEAISKAQLTVVY